MIKERLIYLLKKLYRENKLKFLVFGVLFLLLAPLSLSAATKARFKEKSPVLNIQSFSPGMTAAEVKRVLLKKNVKGYETGFSDLFAYTVAGAEIKLFFTCGSKGQVLSRVELSTLFTTEETETVVPKFKEKLVAKYGMPSITESQWNALDFCWGKCEQDSKGTKLQAKTAVQGTKNSLVLVLSNDGMVKNCEEIRRRKINQWLYQWIGDMPKFKLGMSFRDASAIYQKRYRDKLIPDEERDETVQQYDVTSYVVKDYDFFSGLDYDSFTFEGEGPGTIVLKFTGDQAGKNSKLNRRLYYASFSTTKFSNYHSYPDTRQKLDKWIKVYGKPIEFLRLDDGVVASWQQQSKKTTVRIFDSGLITFEQADPSLQETYRDSAVKSIEEFNKIRFDKQIF